MYVHEYKGRCFHFLNKKYNFHQFGLKYQPIIYESVYAMLLSVWVETFKLHKIFMSRLHRAH